MDNRVAKILFGYLEYLGWPSEIAGHGFRVKGISHCGTQSLSGVYPLVLYLRNHETYHPTTVRQPCQTWTNVGRTVGSNELGSSDKI